MVEGDRIGVILDAAYACFTRHGVRRTTMDDIAREADISRASVYLHVRNKEDAFQRLVARMLDAALSRAQAAIAAPADLTDRLDAALGAKIGLTLRLHQDSPAHAAELLGANARLSVDQMRDYHAAMRSLLADALGPRCPGAEADATENAEILLALTRGLEEDPSEPEIALRRLRQAVTLFVAGLDQRYPIAKEST